MSMKVSSYEVRIIKAVSGGTRNFDSYYLILREQGQNVKYISKAMRNDEDNQDTLTGQVDIKPTLLQLWNYDKMKLVQKFPLNFKKQLSFNFALFSENMIISIKKIPPQIVAKQAPNTPLSNQPESAIVEPQKNKIGSLKNIEGSSARAVKSKGGEPPVIEIVTQKE